jgi:hypothetical protein
MVMGTKVSGSQEMMLREHGNIQRKEVIGKVRVADLYPKSNRKSLT